MLDAAIDRVHATWARATADALGCPRPHSLHNTCGPFRQAWSPSAEWLATKRTHELLPAQGRLCGNLANKVATVCAAEWANHPERWLACALLVTHVDLEYVMRLLPEAQRVDLAKHRSHEAITRVMLPSAFHPDAVALLSRQIYAWRDEPERVLSSGRREPLQAGLLVLQIKELVLGVLVPPPFTAAALHHWLTNGNLAQCSHLRASLLLRFLYYSKQLLDDVSIQYTPRWKQGSVQLFRMLGLVTSPQHLPRVCRLMDRLRVVFGPALLHRAKERMATCERLREYYYVFYLCFGIGDLAWEDVEALCCELKDVLLHMRGLRNRPLRSAFDAAFGMEHLPMSVAYENVRCFVGLDMSPAAIIPCVAGLAAHSNFEKYTAILTNLHSELQRRKRQRSPTSDDPAV